MKKKALTLTFLVMAASQCLRNRLKLKRSFGNIDVDWTTTLSYQFLKCLQVTLLTDFRYYNGVKIPKKYTDESYPVASYNPNHEHSAERVQFKGTIGFGLGYSF